MSQSTLAAIAVALVATIAAVGVWYSQRYPREIVGAGTIRVEIGGSRATLRTRDVAVNGVRFQEVELPGGTWIGCSGDCARAVRDATDDFWDKQRREK